VRSRWQAIYQGLKQSVETNEAVIHYEALQRDGGGLSRFESPLRLLAHLHARDGDLDEKDRIYAHLVRAAQRHSSESDLARSMVWLGLWPALSGILRRLSLRSALSEDPVSEIGESLSRRIERLDLGVVHRVAATLVRSTERDIRERRRVTRGCEAREITLLEEAHVSDGPILPADRELALLRDRLGRVLGDDVHLVLAAVCHDVPQRQIAAQLGISPEAVKKRFQRALKRLRAAQR
jgi:RNA polymerase sigma-70 factor (ECF subfamily)